MKPQVIIVLGNPSFPFSKLNAAETRLFAPGSGEQYRMTTFKINETTCQN